MKQKDIALIIVIAFIGAVVSIIVSKQLFPATSHQVQVISVQPILPDFPTPNPAYFNSTSIDPTQTINIGQNNNSSPF